jgi:hypothetical protein
MRIGLELAALGALSVALIAIAVWIVLQVKERSPERRELNRRRLLNQRGRLGDALITEATDTIIYYAYSIHGVHYAASQDVTALRDKLPPEPERLIGVANMKYAVRNPANSILICEGWSGLRAPADNTPGLDVPAVEMPALQMNARNFPADS